MLLPLIIIRKHNGHTLDELPYRAYGGVWGSYFVMLITVLALLAQFYVGLYPAGDSADNLSATYWFQAYLAGPLLIFLFLVWKVYSWFKRPEDRPLWISTANIDIYSGMREAQRDISGPNVSKDQRFAGIARMKEENNTGAKGKIMTALRHFI